MEQNNPNYTNQPQQSNNFGQQQQQFQNQNQNQGNYQFPYQGEKLAGDPSSITLGIISLVLFFVGCWCYGLVAIITLILSIIGLIIANRSLKVYNSDPSKYSQSSFKSVNIGKIINIVGVAISGLVCFVILIVAIFFGSILMAAVNGELDSLDDLDQYNNESYYDDDYEESQEDQDWQYYEEETDSIKTDLDSIEIEQIDIEETIIEETEG